MARDIALICTEHPEIKEEVAKIGNIMAAKDMTKLEGIAFGSANLTYTPIFLCKEGSPAYEKMKNNNWIDEDGRKYDVMKEARLKE